MARKKHKNTIYIVGGGPSLCGVDLTSLENKTTIAINRSFESLRNPSVIFFTDLRYYNWSEKEEIFTKKLSDIPCLKITTSPHICDSSIINFRLTGTGGIDFTPGCLRGGNNSGYAAINLALHLGAEKIVLLGFDMQPDKNGRTHHHDGYPVKNRQEVYNKMMKYWGTIREPLDKLGVEVINACPTSRIDVFDKITPEEALKCA